MCHSKKWPRVRVGPAASQRARHVSAESDLGLHHRHFKTVRNQHFTSVKALDIVHEQLLRAVFIVWGQKRAPRSQDQCSNSRHRRVRFATALDLQSTSFIVCPRPMVVFRALFCNTPDLQVCCERACDCTRSEGSHARNLVRDINPIYLQ